MLLILIDAIKRDATGCGLEQEKGVFSSAYEDAYAEGLGGAVSFRMECTGFACKMEKEHPIKGSGG
jgi:hypothetical protein